MLESRTNNEAKFNFIGIKKKKKTKGVPKIFLKGRQIKNFKLLYINFFFQVRVVLRPLYLERGGTTAFPSILIFMVLKIRLDQTSWFD